jgi:hypothetical protein
MPQNVRLRDVEDEKARRRAPRAIIGVYHEQQLRLLLEHVREGFARLDAGEIDAFELDDLVHPTSAQRRSYGALLLHWRRRGERRAQPRVVA